LALKSFAKRNLRRGFEQSNLEPWERLGTPEAPPMGAPVRAREPGRRTKAGPLFTNTGASQLALRLLRLIVDIRLDRARSTCRALGSMDHGCDRGSVAFTTVYRTVSTAARARGEPVSGQPVSF
jgi:hypothetical protein